MRIPESLLVGQSRDHLVEWEASARFVHAAMAEDLARLKAAASGAGFDLQVASAHRSFADQLRIWNEKAEGRRKVVDDAGEPLNVAELAPEELIRRILRWSALPGASRHHWGTDIDVFDRNALAPGCPLQLTVAESETVFAAFHRWLDGNMRSFGFYRPYARDLGGVAPEPWHLSYVSVAEDCLAAHSVGLLERTLRASDIALKDRVLARLPDIYALYVRGITLP